MPAEWPAGKTPLGQRERRKLYSTLCTNSFYSESWDTGCSLWRL